MLLQVRILEDAERDLVSHVEALRRDLQAAFASGGALQELEALASARLQALDPEGAMCGVHYVPAVGRGRAEAFRAAGKLAQLLEVSARHP